MLKSIKKFLAIGVIVSSIITLNPIGASAEWRQDSNGWWNTEGNSWSIGWREINGKWYYFNNSGYMVTNTTINGYKIDNNGVWVQNTTTTNNVNSNNATDNSTKVENTVTTNSNNMTNLTNNNDNSTKNTLSNTGTINNNIENNTTNINIDKSKTTTKTDKNDKGAGTKVINEYYKTQLSEAKDKLADAKAQLEKAKSTNLVKTMKKQADGTWKFVGEPDTKFSVSKEKEVSKYEKQVEQYEDLLK